jgi:hypothetical protein
LYECVQCRQAFSFFKILLEKVYQLFIIPIRNKNLYNFDRDELKNLSGKKIMMSGF